MATETIKVVKREEIILSNDEREILYDKIGKQSKLDEYHFPIFAEQDNQIVEDSVKNTLPSILTILGRRVLKHDLIYPVFNSTFAVKNVKYDDIRNADIKSDPEEQPIENDELEKITVGVDVNIYGGDPQTSKTDLDSPGRLKTKNHIKPEKSQKKSENPGNPGNQTKESFLDIAKNMNTSTSKRGYGFDVEFDEPVHAIVDGQIVQIATRQKINVGGYVIKPHPIISSYLQNMIKKEIGRGLYRYKNIAINDTYADIPTIIEKTTMFNDENDAYKELRLLFHFIKWYDSYLKDSNINFLWDVRMAHGSGAKLSFRQKNIANAIKIPARGNNVLIPPEKVAPLLQQFLKRLAPIYDINQYSYSQIMVDLLEIAQFNLWEHVFLLGFDSSFDDKMEILKKEKTRREDCIRTQHSQNERYIKNMKYVHIVREKYGKEKVKTLDINKDILSQLKKTEREFIESEYAKNEKIKQQKRDNVCEHIQHVENIRNMTQRDSMIEEYNLLKPFISKKKDGEFPLCKECEYPLICPHIIEEIELNIAKMSPKAIREKMMKFIGDASIEDKYFCKYCGEHILDVLQIEVNDFMEENMPGYGDNQVDTLKSIIWNEISYLIYNRIYFQDIYSVKTLIQHISDNIYEYIYDVEKKLNKAKTNTSDMIEERVRLYTTIYGLANLINLIKNNSGKLWFPEPKTRESPKSPKLQKAGKMDLGTLFTQAMKILVDSKNISIRKFNISNANLLIFLKKAYLSLVGTSWVEKVPDGQSWVPFDPFFKYIVKTCEIFADPKSGYDRTNMITYFTKSEKDLKSQSGLYEYIKSPFNKPALGSVNISNVEIGDELFRLYWQMNFEQMFVSINSGIYKEPRYQGKYNDKQVAMDRSIMPFERLIFDHYRVKQAPVYFQFPLVNTRKYHDVLINMAEIYDSDGKKHKWNIFVFNINGKKVEIAKKDVANMISSNDYKKMELVDYKCSVCSQYASKTTGKNIEGILNELDKVQNFFRYYEYRCPVGEVHDWSQGDSNEMIICKHCHISKKKYQEHDQSYYNKHVAKYDNRVSNVKYEEPQFPVNRGLTTFVNKWNFNTNIITEIAKLSGKKYNVLANLGFTEGIEYDDIVAGTANPSLKLKPTKYHMDRLSGYVNLLIREYNILKSRSFVKTVPTAIKTMIKDYQFKPEELPDILVEYKQHISDFVQNVKKGFYFIVDALYKTMYLMYKSSKNSVLKVFGEYIFEKILLTDMLFSKPREAYLGLISDKDADNDKLYESDVDDDPSDEVEGFDYTPDEGEAEDQEYQGEY